MSFDEELRDPSSRFSLAIFRINGLLMRNGDRITKSLGQSSARWQVLGRAGQSPQSVAQMARDMGLARQSVQRVADALEKDGLVTFRDSPDDQRIFLVEITELGRDILSKIYEKNKKWSQRFLQRLSSEVLLAASAKLEKISVVLEGLENEEENP